MGSYTLTFGFPLGGPPEDYGAITFAYKLDSGCAVTYTWATDVFRSDSGIERRASLLDAPRQAYKGFAVVTGDDVRANRATLVRYASLGLPFRVGLPWEELTIIEDPDGAVIHVDPDAFAACDWASIVGQRIIVMGADGTSSVLGAIVSASAGDVTLDEPAGDVGNAGGRVMPTIEIYLEAQQGFSRYNRVDGNDQSTVERWQLNARANEFGFATPAVAASLPLEGLAMSGVLDDVILVARIPGVGGNAITVQFSDDALTSGGEFIEVVEDGLLHVKYEGDTTTAAELAALLFSSELVEMTGTWNDADVLAASDDEFSETPMSGGIDADYAEVGVGATLVTYDGFVVWDRGVDSTSQVSDSVQLCTDIIDLGGVLSAVGDKTNPDWGRQLNLTRTDTAERQWLMRFLDAVRGQWKTFWLPTWRADIVYVSHSGPTMTVSTNISVWFDSRDRIMVVQEDVPTYVQIVAVLDNMDGTWDLTLSAELSEDAVDIVSWLERCRLDSDEITITYAGAGMAFQQLARAIDTVTDTDIVE